VYSPLSAIIYVISNYHYIISIININKLLSLYH
jgi:hypothetical protein